MPSFEVDGTEYHMGSFNGFKLMGVKPQSDANKQAALHKLAQYLSGAADVTPQGLLNADMDQNGEVTFADVGAIYQYLVG